jgi:hypothetical protein
VVFDGYAHPLQRLTQAFQLAHGWKYWQTTHAIIYAFVDYYWLRFELGWDGLVVSRYLDGTTVNEANGISIVALDYSVDITRLSTLLNLYDNLGSRLRYSPWGTIPQVLGKQPAFFNCSSLVSYLLWGIMVDTPANLREILED